MDVKKYKIYLNKSKFAISGVNFASDTSFLGGNLMLSLEYLHNKKFHMCYQFNVPAQLN